MYLKEITLPRYSGHGDRKKGEKYSARWAEFPFRAVVDHASGYRVTMAALFDPITRRLYFGASACAPEDVFSRRDGINRAMGRARELATQFLNGMEKDNVPRLTGSWEDSMVILREDSLQEPDFAERLRALALQFVPHVVDAARARKLEKQLHALGVHEDVIMQVMNGVSHRLRCDMPVWSRRQKQTVQQQIIVLRDKYGL